MRYELIAARPSHFTWLEQLRRAAYRDLFEATWGAWDEERHNRHFSECIARGNIHIIERGSEPVGMVQMFEGPDDIEIGEIQIDPKRQNQGIGTRVLGDLVAHAHDRGMSVRLNVALKNDGALRLYERLGFLRVGQSETHNLMVNRP